MEKQETQWNFDPIQKRDNIIKADPNFYNKFRQEWEEITKTLRKIRDEGQTKITNEKSYRLTSSSLIFK